MKDALSEDINLADIAGLRILLEPATGGLILVISGWCSKLSQLLQRILQGVSKTSCFSPTFSAVKEQLVVSSDNWDAGKSSSFASKVTEWLLRKEPWNEGHIVPHLRVSQKEMFNYVENLLDRTFAETIVEGNFTKDAAKEIGERIRVKFPRPPPKSLQTWLGYNMLPAGSDFAYRATQAVLGESQDECISFFLAVGRTGNFNLEARLAMFWELVKTPAWIQWQELAYTLWTDAGRWGTLLGFNIVIQSLKTARLLEERVEDFLDELGAEIAHTPEKSFVVCKQACIQKYFGNTAEFGKHVDTLHSSPRIPYICIVSLLLLLVLLPRNSRSFLSFQCSTENSSGRANYDQA